MNTFGRLQHAAARRAVRRHFAALRVAERGLVEAVPQDRPCLVALNHGGWWDGFVCAWLVRLFPNREFRLAQERRQLKRYPWFRQAGALPVDLAGEGRLKSDLKALAGELARPGGLLFLFPEGVLQVRRPGGETAKRGAAWLAAKAGAMVLPCALRYGFRLAERPEVWARFGPGVEAGDDVAGALAEAERELEKAWWSGDAAGGVPMWPARRPLNERLCWWAREDGADDAGEGR